MTTMSLNNQKEDESKKALAYFLSPWQTMETSQDTGIDVFVQPYDEKNRNDNDSIPIFERRFLVQLKSTDAEIIDENQGIGKLQIDKKHLEMWNKQEDPVMIARYYRKKKVFYFAWIDEIEIKTGQQSQTIDLPYQLSADISEQTKETILRKLMPPDISELVYIPKGRGIGFAEVTIGNVRDGQQIADMVSNGYFERFAKQAQLQNAIMEHKFLVYEHQENKQFRFNLALLLIMSKAYNEATQELNLLSHTFNLVEAKIMISALVKRDLVILDNLDKIGFSYYLRIVGPPDNESSLKAIIDDKEYNFGIHSNNVLEIPVQSFGKIDSIELSTPMKNEGPLGSGRLFSVPLHLNNKIQILRGIKIGNQSCHEHDVLLVEDEIRINNVAVI